MLIFKKISPTLVPCLLTRRAHTELPLTFLFRLGPTTYYSIVYKVQTTLHTTDKIQDKTSPT